MTLKVVTDMVSATTHFRHLEVEDKGTSICDTMYFNGCFYDMRIVCLPDSDFLNCRRKA